MKTKMIRVPFEVELAKKITNGEIDGKIVTRDGRSARVICWDFSNIQNIVSAISQEDGVENLSSIFHDGTCSLSSRCDEDLFIEIPEYMTFKDGDVYKTEKGSVAIYNGNYQAIMNNTPYYVGLRKSDGILMFQSNDYGFGVIQKCTLDVTKEEKQHLIDALKTSKNPKAKECLKILGIEVKQEYEFKPFDKVLVRCYDESQWCARFFDRMFKGNYACTDSLRYKQCIPYNEQTAHLLGTTEKYE